MADAVQRSAVDPNGQREDVALACWSPRQIELERDSACGCDAPLRLCFAHAAQGKASVIVKIVGAASLSCLRQRATWAPKLRGARRDDCCLRCQSRIRVCGRRS